METSSAGAVLATYIYDEAGTPLAIIQAANSPYNATAQDQVVYLHTDHLGTPRMATDSNRSIVWKWESDAFGSTVPQQDPDGDGKQTIVNLRFPGQYYDAESGLHQNWHRTYDPSLGCYISSDPIGLAGGVNIYGYVLNDPVNLMDLEGNLPSLPQGVVDAAAGFGDGLTGGLTSSARDMLDVDGGVNECSDTYHVAEVVGEYWPTSRGQHGYNIVKSAIKIQRSDPPVLGKTVQDA
ncbi:MAG: RHS domain-containing protein [Candidatus Thiothrix singaporensis]|uniref:RHS domain-containing protein n=1 Tax=Candidatus Thiothrix singaporensis TaxID=2799669 RepID=A0A7L6AYM6_9GAMM|nr:MAG: RHS domain-containing protein [Candidatus Thiothrix singaporensis]